MLFVVNLYVSQGINYLCFLQIISDNIMEVLKKKKRESSPQHIPNSSPKRELATSQYDTSPVVRPGSWKVLSSQLYEGKNVSFHIAEKFWLNYISCLPGCAEKWLVRHTQRYIIDRTVQFPGLWRRMLYAMPNISDRCRLKAMGFYDISY